MEKGWNVAETFALVLMDVGKLELQIYILREGLCIASLF